MIFTKHLRPSVRSGRIRCTIRIWTRLKVKVGGRYRMDDGHVVVESITPMQLAEITDDLARESGFSDVKDLLAMAKHGSGDNVYLIRFHYLAPVGWDVQITIADEPKSSDSRSQLLRRIRSSAPRASTPKKTAESTTPKKRRRTR